MELAPVALMTVGQTPGTCPTIRIESAPLGRAVRQEAGCRRARRPRNDKLATCGDLPMRRQPVSIDPD